MARKTEFSSKGQTIAATTAQLITFDSSILPSDKLVALHVGFTGAGNTFADVLQVQVNASGNPIFRCTGDELRAYLDRYTRANFNLATSAQRFTIPFFLPDAEDEDQADICQFPRRSSCELILSLGASTAAGTAYCGWTITNQRSLVYPALLSSAMGIEAAQALKRYSFNEEGILRGVAIPTAGIQRGRIVVAGETVKETPGADFLATTTGDLWVEAEALDGGGVNISSTVFSNITTRKSAPLNSSYVELETHASNWAGVTNRCCLYALRNNKLAEEWAPAA